MKHVNRNRQFGSALIIAFACAFSGSLQAGVYKWVDDEGNIHYGDRPPEKTGSAHSVLNNRGLQVREVNRARTEEELAAEAAQAEQMRAQHLEEQRIRHRDNILLQTFTTERDLLLTRDDRLSAIDGAILLSERRINSWSEKLANLQERINQYESEEQIPNRMKDERTMMQRRISSSEAYLDEKVSERKRIADQFEQDLARYRELKSES